MDRETERDIWAIHDRRLSEQDNKIHDTQTSIKSVEHEIHQLIERINMGVSPTQNKILEKQATIELVINNLDHKLDLSLKDINDEIEKRMGEFILVQHEQGESINMLKKIFIFGIVIGVVAAGVKSTIDHFTSEQPIQKTRVR